MRLYVIEQKIYRNIIFNLKFKRVYAHFYVYTRRDV